MNSPLRIGTRASPLALTQTGMIAAALAIAHGGPAAEIVPIRTSGDATLDRPLSEIGGKGLFTKEIDEALLAGRVDLAVHSAKDLPTMLPDGIVIACVPLREDPRDVLIARVGSLAELPDGARVGTSSLRRAAQILHQRPGLRVVPLRGNVETRLRRIEEGHIEATLLAAAGLNRMRMLDRASAILSEEEMLPAVSQGALAVTCRADDTRIRDLLAALDHAESHQAIRAERAFLRVLDGSCRTPIAALAVIAGEGLLFRGLVASPDGRNVHTTRIEGKAAHPEQIGMEAGFRLREKQERMPAASEKAGN